MNLPANNDVMNKAIQDAFPTLRKTTCPYCGVGCGVDAQMSHAIDDNGKMCSKLESVSGTPEHPANNGRLCVKGSKLVQSNGTDNGINNRLLAPKLHGKDVSWSTATSYVAQQFCEAIDTHGPDSVAFYVSGQLLTEDYYVANKLMKGFIGSANIDTNSRLCMSSAVAGYKRAFGADAVPCCYEDLELTQLMVFVGSNAAWTHPVLYQRIERAKKLNPAMKIVVIDPRKTPTCDLADLHLAIKPGSDAAIFNGLLKYLSRNGGVDKSYVAEHTEGLEAALLEANNWCEECVSEFADVPINKLKQFYQWFAQSTSAISFYSMGVNQSTSGVDKSNAIINCHLASGKIGKPGSGPFSLTGQPNAMGGREVGGLANMLASHMDIQNPQHREIVQEFWQSPTIADKQGRKAVDLFKDMQQGKIKAIWIMATNPVVSMPDRDFVEQALSMCDLVVVSDCVASNDTLKHAHVALPATGWSEKNGTVTNSERRISRQRGLLAPTGEAKHDWQIICEVARKMGFSQGFDFRYSYEVFNEHVTLSGYRNDSSENGSIRDFDISGLGQLSLRQYDNLAPVQWPVTAQNPGGTKRLFTDKQFYTASGKAQILPITPRLPEQSINKYFPFVLNTGRIRDQWHTMTRTGYVAELQQHISEPLLHIHPSDARILKIKDGQLVKLTAKHKSLSSKIQQAEDVDQAEKRGCCLLKTRFDSNQRRGELFAPMHWNAEFAAKANINRLVGLAVDPISGQPELKSAAVALMSWNVSRWATIVCDQPIDAKVLAEQDCYWIKQVLPDGYCYQFAFEKTDELQEKWLKNLINLKHQHISLQRPVLQGWLALKQGTLTQGTLNQETMQLQSILWTSERPLINNADWFAHLLSRSHLEEDACFAILKQEISDEFQNGPLVCSCFSVREKQILDAIDDGVDSVEALGKKLKCGTNCGSCKAELGSLIKQAPRRSLQNVKDLQQNSQTIKVEVIS